MKTISPELFEGVWSATPTPLKENLRVDTTSIPRLVKHHQRLGVKGLFIAGTCGEGPWLPDAERRTLTQAVVKSAKGKMPVAVQVTDNSALRIIDKIKLAEEDGADAVVIAPPHFLLNATPDNLRNHYLQAITASTLPVILYHFGPNGHVPMPLPVLKAALQEENVVAVKDSSLDPRFRDAGLAARRKNPNLRLLNGGEFNCVEYIEAGYDGLMLGGAAFNGYMAQQIIDAVHAGDIALANRIQKRMSRIMFSAYGGKKIACWLSGEKYLLQQLGVLKTWSSYLNFPLNDSCRKAIDKMVTEDADVLLP